MTLPELERLAREATRGEWHVDGQDVWRFGGDPICCGNGLIVYSAAGEPIGQECCGNPDWQREKIAEASEQNAAYIAAMSPDACLALIERVRKAELNGLETAARWHEISAAQWRSIAERDLGRTDSLNKANALGAALQHEEYARQIRALPTDEAPDDKAR